MYPGIRKYQTITAKAAAVAASIVSIMYAYNWHCNSSCSNNRMENV
jgi:hypothetical protein